MPAIAFGGPVSEEEIARLWSERITGSQRINDTATRYEGEIVFYELGTVKKDGKLEQKVSEHEPSFPWIAEQKTKREGRVERRGILTPVFGTLQQIAIAKENQASTYLDYIYLGAERNGVYNVDRIKFGNGRWEKGLVERHMAHIIGERLDSPSDYEMHNVSVEFQGYRRAERPVVLEFGVNEFNALVGGFYFKVGADLVDLRVATAPTG